jgi:CHAT domain-containing protein
MMARHTDRCGSKRSATAARALSAFGDPSRLEQPLQRYEILVMHAELSARTGRYAHAERELREASDVIDAWRGHADSRALRHLAFQRATEFGDPDYSVATVLRLLAMNGRAEAAFELGERRRARQLKDELTRASALREVGEDSALAAVALPAGVTARKVSGALPDDETALVQFVTGRGGEVTTAFVITREGLRAIPLTPIDSLAPAIARFVGLLEAGGPADALARQLGDGLLEPVIRTLPPTVRRLLVVPDDVLHRLPFDAVRLADGRYAIERFTISTVPSAAVAVMLLQRPVPAAPVRLLALGDPRFSGETLAAAGDSSLARSPIRRRELVRLTASGREAELAARFAPFSDVRLRETASERFLKAARLDTFEVIHLATHAFVDDRAIGRSVLVLAGGDGEDGFLTTGDLAALQLRAELVVLSACRTAGGVLLGGEGVHGLAAPLLGAGARTVVATSWQVNDRDAARLVDRFYRALADVESLGDALRTAKLEALRSGRPPREWVSWALIGDPIAGVPLRHPRSRSTWWLAAVALVAVTYYGARTVNRSKREMRSAPSA